MSLSRSHLLLALGLAFSGHEAARAGSPVLSWPGSGACAGTLQACIDSAPVDATLDLVPTAVIDEHVSIARSLTLRGRSAARAQFADGRRITVASSGSANLVLRLQDLGLQNGQIQVNHASTGRALIELSGLRMRASSAAAHSGIIVDLGSSGTTEVHEVRVLNNDLQLVAPSIFDAGVELSLFGSGRRARIELSHNRIRAGAQGQGPGVLVDVAGGADADVIAHANEIQGAFGRALRISEGRFSTTASTLRADVVSNALVGGGDFTGGGLDVITNNGSIELEAINNTIVFGSGLVVTRWGDGSGGPQTGSVTGGIFNNLIANTRFGLQNTPSLGGNATVDWNLKWQNNPAGAHTAGANDLSADPQLRSMLAPRLTAGSPARNAGNGFALLRVPAALTNHDADGLRRLVNAVDIGAFEFGHRSLQRRKTTAAASPQFPIVDAELDLDSSRRIFVTRNFGAGPVTNNAPVGVSFFDQWFVTNLGGQNMAQNVTVNLFAPIGTSTNGVFQHLASGSNTLDGSSLIDWSPINGQPDRILLATQATPFGTPFHPGAVVLSYVGNRWNLVSADGSNFVTNTRWNLYSQLPSPQAFVHEVRADNRNGSSGSLIGHPRLDGVACAQIQVMPLAGSSAAGSIVDVEYLPTLGRHQLFSNNGALPLGARFHVLILPEQIEDCAGGALFRDGFDGFG
ncbi:choice-of-anchor Q domain-containing protein [uncultured Aquimonas sp.]|uniref:DUF7452 domain-containing protein n=1 Tax=uncultured Aquimonas sp. TaxID=385483 RepID=UPI0008692F47|nr:choice-of-anchor Q domain-containing protein [uncultured Aquimonas sp.]ODU41164.1 MAG: hypothetical protein ABS96_32845 [Xanthomonadaceae bacterium SCN 69-123]